MGRFANDSGSISSDARPPDPVNIEASEAAAPSSPVDKPLPGAFLSTDDMYIMKASFLSKCWSHSMMPGSSSLIHMLQSVVVKMKFALSSLD